MTRTTISMCCAALALSCGASGNRQQPNTAYQPVGVSQPSSYSYSTGTPTPVSLSRAERLAVGSVLCFSDVWPETRVAPSDTRAQLPERRCAEALQGLYGAIDPARVERIRSMDPAEITALRERVVAQAQSDPTRLGDIPAIVAFFDTALAAEGETVSARSATDRLRTEAPAPAGEATSEDGNTTTGPANPVREAHALALLYQGSYGDLTPQAHSLALLFAIQRINATAAFAPTLRVYALEQPLAAVLDVPAYVPDQNAPAQNGDAQNGAQNAASADEAALNYFTRAAAAAGHPVLTSARTPADRELLASTGLIDGLGDRLRVALERMPVEGDLTRIVATVAQRVNVDLRTVQADVVQRTGQTPPANIMGTPR